MSMLYSTRFAHFARLTLALACFSSIAGASLITADFSTGDGMFVPNSGNWTYTAPSWNLFGANGLTGAGLTSPTMTASGGQVTLQFSHTRNFEVAFDGGYVELSVNGGAFSRVPGTSFSQNGYTSSLFNFGESFSGDFPTPLTSIADLGNFGVADNFALRFVANFDASVLRSTNAWNLLSVSLSNTELRPGFAADGAIPEPATTTLVLLGVAGVLGLRRYRRQ